MSMSSRKTAFYHLISVSALLSLLPLLLAMRLHFEPGTKAVIKLGVCPYPNYLRRCGINNDSCTDDLDCPHESLCCNDGCNRACSTPRLENVVGYVVLGGQLKPLNAPSSSPHTPVLRHKSVSVQQQNWASLLAYLCAVADRLHPTPPFQCVISCSQDSDCPTGDPDQTSGVIKCCNNCCLDPTQLITQQRQGENGTSLQDLNLMDASTSTTIGPPRSKPGLCPPVIVGPGAAGNCENRCKKDADCDGPTKCCRNECGGYACQKPISFSLGYGEALAAPIPASDNSGTTRPPSYSRSTIRAKMYRNIPISWDTVTPVTRHDAITVFLGVQPSVTTESTPDVERCNMPPTSYTECIGSSPWRTRYYFHKSLNQCLPIYRCVRKGNNFNELSGCERSCVKRSMALI